MFNIGFQEIIIVVIAAIVFVGPKELPGAAKKIGKGFFKIKKEVREIMNKLQRSLDLDE